MKMLYDFIPANTSDSSVTISASTSAVGFPSTNLKEIQPVKAWKSTAITDSYILYDFGAARSLTGLFLNRFNFASFRIQGNATSDFSSPSYNVLVSAQTKDEIYDENYMHYFHEFNAFNYRYLRIFIPGQTPLFESTYFKVGNLLVGNYVETWNPKAGYSVEYVEKADTKEFDSGYTEEVKIGRTKRIFSGQFDKISNTEYNKIRYTRNPVVLYHDWESDPTKCYLVRPTASWQKSFDYAQVTSHSYAFIELV